MNIVVCVKQVVDTEAVIALDGAGEVELTGQTMVIDPYSEFAVERAVQLKEELGGTVTLLTLGSQDCLAAVRHGLAMGADAAVLIEDDQWTARDAAQAAALLAEAASTMGADLIMGGWKSGDTAAAQVMGRMAAIMGLPLANMATGLSVEGDAIVAECEVDDGVETARLPLPAVVAAQQGLAEPRYPSVRDVMQARRRGAEVRPVADLAAAAEPTTVTVVSRELKPGRSGGRIVAGEAPEAVAESTHELARRIRASQIVMIPGGFSGGDEPDGSAKFITAFFRAPEVTEAVRDLLKARDGLMLGICNGFQALVKLGLVPYGDIVDATPDAPTLTFNTIGRHQSRLVRTRISSNLSPWLSQCSLDDPYTVAISHGEGRFVANDEVLAQLIANGQVATQYVGEDGKPSMDLSVNPNGSALAIEGITSPDGRVLGKMGHAERRGDNLYRNVPEHVPGDKFMPIFESGVAYFA